MRSNKTSACVETTLKEQCLVDVEETFYDWQFVGKKKNSHKARFLSVLSDSQLIRSSFLSFSALSVSCLKCSIWPLKWSSDVSTVKGKCWLKCPFSKFYILHNPTLLYLLYVLYRCVYFLVCVCWEYSSGSNSVSQAQGEIPTCCSPAKLQLWCLCKN